MDHQISEILRYSREWRRIGIETCLCNVEKIWGIRKLHRVSIKITGIEFNNKGSVGLHSLKIISPGVVFNNGSGVYLGSLIGWFMGWKNNIKRIHNKRLLNLMIKQGIFER